MTVAKTTALRDMATVLRLFAEEFDLAADAFEQGEPEEEIAERITVAGNETKRSLETLAEDQE